MIILMAGICWFWNPWWTAVFLFLKIGIDSFLVFQVSKDLNIKIAARSWPLLGVIYPFYAIYVAIRSNIGQYVWKGRRYSTG